MDLTSLYRMVSAEAPSVPEQMMRGAANQAALQQVDEQLMANQRLRDLYANNPNPSFGSAAAISPEYAQKMQQFNNEQLMQQYKMLESQGNIEEQRRKTQESKQHTFANTLGVGVENWLESLGGRQPTAEDIEAFKPKLGGMLKFVDETYGYKPDVAIDPYHPEQILSTAESLGYASRRAKTAQETQLRNIPPQMSPQQYYGEQHTTPEGYVTRTPGMGGQVTARAQRPMQAPSQPPVGQEDITEPQLQAYIASLPEGPDKQRLMSVISRGQSMAPGSTSTVEVTPEDLAKIRKFNEADKASAVETARETAKAEVARGEEGKRITDAFKRAVGTGGVSRVMKLISESTSGPTEALGASVAARIPQPGGSRATPGMENIGSLNTVAGELRKTIERSSGPQSDKDVALAALDAADISNPNIPYNQRMKGFLEFTRIIKERADALGIDSKAIGIDVDTETGKKLSQGHKEDGYTFKGGDPSDPKNWEKD